MQKSELSDEDVSQRQRLAVDKREAVISLSLCKTICSVHYSLSLLLLSLIITTV